MRFHAAFALAAIALSAAQLLVPNGTLRIEHGAIDLEGVLNRQRFRRAPQDVEKLNPGSGAQVIVKVHGYLIAVPPEVKPVQQLPGLQLIESSKDLLQLPDAPAESQNVICRKAPF
jgi:hypothetical protein